MIKNTVALRYSKALFDQDSDKVHLEERLSNFAFILASTKGHPKLLNFLKAPQIDVEEKKRVLQSLLSGRSDSAFLHFLYYLIEKGRFKFLQQIASEYRTMVNHYLGVWEAKIITGVPIEPDIEDKLRVKLETFYRKKIRLKKEINPKMIGGAILVVGNEMIDWSIKSRLKKLKETLLATSV